MRTLFVPLVLLVAALMLTGVYAGDGKTKDLKGTITCAKCDLGKEAKCMTVVVVKEDKKDVVYYFDPESSKKFHSKVCTTPTEGTVTGTVMDQGEKKIVTVKDVKFK
jgi:hypothetical protein